VEETYQQEVDRIRRKRQIIGIGVIAALLLGSFSTVAIVTHESNKTRQVNASATTTTLPGGPGGNAPKGNTGPAVALTFPEPGATMDTPVCPAADGSSPRTTSFGGPPPMCIDVATKDYTATILTSASDTPFTVALTTDATPNTVNNFVFLSRYHYYEGMPVNRIVPGGWFEVASGTQVPGPGYTIAGEAPPKGMLFSPLTLGVAESEAGKGTNNGGFLLGIPDASNRIADTPVTATAFGTVLDGIDTAKTISKAGRDDAQPAQEYTIVSITIAEDPKR
jgi:cyclophilin family peptidyl-prolyl cis-trans isomerase